METSTMSPSINTLYRGRKMKPGKYIPGPARVFICYCDTCNNKVIVPLAHLSSFDKYFRKEKRSMRVRLLTYLISKMNIDDN